MTETGAGRPGGLVRVVVMLTPELAHWIDRRREVSHTPRSIQVRVELAARMTETDYRPAGTVTGNLEP